MIVGRARTSRRFLLVRPGGLQCFLCVPKSLAAFQWYGVIVDDRLRVLHVCIPQSPFHFDRPANVFCEGMDWWSKGELSRAP